MTLRTATEAKDSDLTPRPKRCGGVMNRRRVGPGSRSREFRSRSGAYRSGRAPRAAGRTTQRCLATAQTRRRVAAQPGIPMTSVAKGRRGRREALRRCSACRQGMTCGSPHLSRPTLANHEHRRVKKLSLLPWMRPTGRYRPSSGTLHRAVCRMPKTLSPPGCVSVVRPGRHEVEPC
jgi:hypothetical protein